MKRLPRAESWYRLLIVLLFVLPLALLFLLPGGGLLGGVWFWLALLLCFLLIWALLGAPAEPPRDAAAAIGPRELTLDEQPEAVREVMDVRLATEQDGVRAFRGPLKEPAEAAFEKLKRAAAGQRAVPLMQDDEQLGAAVALVPDPVERATMERRVFPWFNWLLFFLTFITTTWAGAAHEGVDLLREPSRLAVGLPYSLGLLAILGVHELGHFFMAKRHGIDVTPPYFIPVPFALGTFGAFIQMKSPTENRRALFDVAVAGPLAGLAVAIPALLIGLRYSQLVPADAPLDPHIAGGTSVGSSILFAMLAKLSLGDGLAYSHVLRLHPLAFAGWLGLFVTALNLLPIGQLDGGHMARAMLGTRVGGTIGTVALWTLVLLALFVWPGLFIWVLIVFFLAGRGTPPLNDLTPVTPGRKWLGYATFLVLLLILAPLPHAFWNEAGIHCPYL